MHDTEADLLKLKIPDLKALCKERGIKNYSKLAKAQLVQCILTNDLGNSTDSARSALQACRDLQQAEAASLPSISSASDSAAASSHCVKSRTLRPANAPEDVHEAAQSPQDLAKLLIPHDIHTPHLLQAAAVKRTTQAAVNPPELTTHLVPGSSTAAITTMSSGGRGANPRASDQDENRPTAKPTIGTKRRLDTSKIVPSQHRTATQETLQQSDLPTRPPVRLGGDHTVFKPQCLVQSQNPTGHRNHRRKVHLKPSAKVQSAALVIPANDSTSVASFRAPMTLDECHSLSDRRTYLSSSFLPPGLIDADIGDGFAAAVRFVISRMWVNGTFARIDAARPVSRDIWELTGGGQTVFVLARTGESLGATLRHDWETFAAGDQSLHELIRTKMDDEFPEGIAKEFKGDRTLARRCVLAGCAGESFCGPKLRLHELDAESLGRTGAQPPTRPAGGCTFATAAEMEVMAEPGHDHGGTDPVPAWAKRVQLYLPE